MYRYRKIIAHLGLADEEADAAVYHHAVKVAQLAGSEQVCFLHVSAKVDIPDKLKEKYPWLLEPIDEAAERRLHDLAEKTHPAGVPVTHKIEVSDGTALLELLRRARDGNADLIIVSGRDDDRALARKLARKAPCSVMVVPNEPVDYCRILVAVDFSRFSANALDVALAFAEANKNEKIEAVHSFAIPKGYYKTPISREEFAADLEAHARQRYEGFISEADLRGVRVEPHFVLSPLVPETVVSTARDMDCGLVCVGCRGRDALTASLLGTNAEELIRKTPVPLVAVKEKGTGRSLLDSILGN
jgi:nucleotide-binding universal stress UspA family protein